MVPVRLHGFVSPAISEIQLKARLIQLGSFLLRFSSRGGLAVDFVRNGKVEKTHWRAGDLQSAQAFKKRLYDVRGRFGNGYCFSNLSLCV